MKKLSITLLITVAAFFASLALAPASFAQQEDAQAKMSADKTGTNPINFQREFRVYNEYTWLNVPGDGSQNVTTLEFRTPFAGGKWQWRVRARYNSLTADFNDDGIDDVDEQGLGDVDMRFITVPILNMKKLQAWAFGLEVFFDTADEPILGSGATSLGPQVFFAQFFKGGLFAPGLQYKFSIDEDTIDIGGVPFKRKVDQILIDLNFLKMAGDKQSWFFTDPQIVIDNELDEEFCVCDFEFGWMMTKWKPDLKGHSFYIRPSIGVGADRPTDYAVEIGYKIVGF